MKISFLKMLPCLDSDEMATSRRQELNIPQSLAADLGNSAVKAAMLGYYNYEKDTKVDWSSLVQTAISLKISIPPDAELPFHESDLFPETQVQVSNETTLLAAHRLIAKGFKPLALNFANGIHPGGGFLHGARAQEETLCRSSALYHTLFDDRMYLEHRKRRLPDSTDWAILSPDVPVFRADSGEALRQPWLLNFITCAAPYAPGIGKTLAQNLLRTRIQRALSIAQAYGYTSLVLGAWGCGAFGNDPLNTATDFRLIIENEYIGVFSDIIFAITDWSVERRTLGPFRKVFS